MTRNSNRHIEVGQYPKDEDFPLLEPKWFANLTLEPHSDDGDVAIVFHGGGYDTKEQAQGWADNLDFMLAYRSISITRTYRL